MRKPEKHLTAATVPVNSVPVGIVQAVRGAVVDVVFARDDLPELNSALVVEWATLI